MHSIWSGVIGFGLVNIPVRLYSPAKEEILDLDYLHESDHSPIRYARVCKAEEKEIDWDHIVRGYKVNGDYVVLTDEDFKRANARKTQAIDILHFTGEDEIDSMYYEKPYYLEPEARAAKAYALLREALVKTQKVAVATFVLRSREHIVVLKPYNDAIVLNQLRFASEINSPDSLTLPAGKNVTEKELKIAIDLIDASTERFKPAQHKDTYLKELKAVIHEKAKGLKPKKRGAQPVPTKTADLMMILKKSLREHDRVAAR